MNQPLVKNAADEEQVKDAKVKEKLKKNQAVLDLRYLGTLPEFRRFIYPYLCICDRMSVNPSGSMTYFNEGERNVAQKMKADVIEADPNHYIKIMKEGKERS